MSDAFDMVGWPCSVGDGKMLFLVRPPLAAADKILDEIDPAAVTGHTVVDRLMISVIITVVMPSRRYAGEAVKFLPGQFVIVGAQLIAVCIEVARTVIVVRASPRD